MLLAGLSHFPHLVISAAKKMGVSLLFLDFFFDFMVWINCKIGLVSGSIL
jgi:hypothetical protein